MSASQYDILISGVTEIRGDELIKNVCRANKIENSKTDINYCI